MRKEIKYLLLSFPATYLLLVIVSIFLLAMFDGGRCGEYAAFSYPRECGFGELVLTSFTNAFLLSLYFFPVYIVIPLITFFTARHFRIKNQSVLASQSDAISQKSQNITKPIIGIFIVIIIFLGLSLWSASQGFSIFRFFSGNHLDPKNSLQVATTPNEQKLNTQTPTQKQPQNQPGNQTQQVDETVNWKVYGSDYGFKFKYPTDFNIKIYSAKDISFQKNENYLFSVMVLDNPKSLDAQGIKTEIDNQAGEGYPYQENFTTISGINSFKQSRYDDGVQEFYYIPDGNKTININFKFGVGAGMSSNNQNIQLIKQILATFKFIQ